MLGASCDSGAGAGLVSGLGVGDGLVSVVGSGVDVAESTGWSCVEFWALLINVIPPKPSREPKINLTNAWNRKVPLSE